MKPGSDWIMRDEARIGKGVKTRHSQEYHGSHPAVEKRFFGVKNMRVSQKIRRSVFQNLTFLTSCHG
jgi:hypothetical protein